MSPFSSKNQQVLLTNFTATSLPGTSSVHFIVDPIIIILLHIIIDPIIILLHIINFGFAVKIVQIYLAFVYHLTYNTYNDGNKIRMELSYVNNVLQINKLLLVVAILMSQKTAPSIDPKIKTAPSIDSKIKTVPSIDPKIKTAPSIDSKIRTVPSIDPKSRLSLRCKLHIGSPLYVLVAMCLTRMPMQGWIIYVQIMSSLNSVLILGQYRVVFWGGFYICFKV